MPRIESQDQKASLRLVATSSNGVNIPNVPITTAGMSYAVWFKMSGTGNGGVPRLIDHGAQELGVGNAGAGGIQHADLGIGAWTGAGIRLQKGVWYHACITYDNTNARLYLNSQLILTASRGITVGSGSDTLRFGNTGGEAVDGWIRDCLAWVGTTLTQAQVTRLYTTGRPPVAPTVWHKLDDGAGTTSVDSSGNDYASTLTGSWSSDTPVKPRRKTGDNLLPNGDFEYVPPFAAATNTLARWIDGTAAGSTTNDLFGWSLFDKTGTVATKFDTTEKRSGTASLKLSLQSTGSYMDVSNSRSSALAPTYGIPVSPNTSYTLTYWMKTNLVSGDATNGANVTVSERDATGTSIVGRVGTYVKTTTDWAQYTITFTTNPTTRFATVQPRIYGHTGAATLIMNAWFDDIQLVPTVSVVSRPAIQDMKSSLLLNGTNQYATSTATNIGQMASVGSATVRFKLNSLAVPAAIWGKGLNLTGWQIVLRSDGLRAEAGNSSTTIAAVGPKLEKGVWYEAGMTFDGSNLRLYLDGRLVATSPSITTISTNVAPLTVGRGAGGSFDYTAGNIARAKYFPSLLTNQQMLDHFLTGVNPIAPDVQWNLDEGAGTTATDTSGNGNNGTITGATFFADTSMKKRELVGGNLIRNGDFEYTPPFTAATSGNDRWIDGTAAGSVANDLFTWRANVNTGGPVGSLRFDTSVKRSGTASLKVVCTTPAAGVITVGITASLTTPVGPTVENQRKYMIPVLPNTSYTLSGYLKTDSISALGRGARLRVVEYGGVSTSSTGSANGAYLTGTNDWMPQTVVFTTSSNTKMVNIWLQLDCSDGTTGTAWFDDVELRPTTPVTRAVTI